MSILIPNWQVPSHVKALCSTRQNGVSLSPWNSLNLGLHVKDNPEHVLQNRQIWQNIIQFHHEKINFKDNNNEHFKNKTKNFIDPKLLFLNQIHGNQIICLDDLGSDYFDLNKQNKLNNLNNLNMNENDLSILNADAAYTKQSNKVCTIMVADCLPVLLTDCHGRQVAAAHAGWRGLAGFGSNHRGILETTVESFSTLALDKQGFDASDLIAWLGPCIGSSAFEVGVEVRDAFVNQDSKASAFFQEINDRTCAKLSEKYVADLAGLARLRLKNLGVSEIYGNDSSLDWCTFQNPDLFFSYRRDQTQLGATGRFAACVWLA